MKEKLLIAASFLTVICTATPLSAAAAARFPAKGTVKLSPTPVALLLHYIDGTGNGVLAHLREFHYATPDFTRASALKAVAAAPCSRGDRIKISASRFEGDATGIDAAGIGR